MCEFAAHSDTDKRMNKLLEKTRKVGRAVQAKHEGEPLNYSNLSKLLSECSTANVYIVDKSGRLLGYNWLPKYTSKALSESFKDGVMPFPLCREVLRRLNHTWMTSFVLPGLMMNLHSM